MNIFFIVLPGLIESCGGCLTSIGDMHSMVGTVGVPITTFKARLESVLVVFLCVYKIYFMTGLECV